MKKEIFVIYDSLEYMILLDETYIEIFFFSIENANRYIKSHLGADLNRYKAIKESEKIKELLY